MELSEKAQKIFNLKYSRPNESWEQASWRVANYIASAEKSYGKSEKEILEVATTYYQMISNLHFIPGGRILANAGTGIKSMMNCFVLGLEDSRSSIYQTLKDAAEIFAHGGGCGYDFSNIREEGSTITTTGGKASGPLSFMTLFDQTGEVIQQASRRGAQMGMLSVHHPDVLKFIDFKSSLNSRNTRLVNEYQTNLHMAGKTVSSLPVLEKTLLDDQLTHFNLSVILDDLFMEKVEDDLEWNLEGKDIKQTIYARDLLTKIATRAWESGDPGLFFIDRVNKDNVVPYLGKLSCTNPCGEVPLLSNEACCLGSINLHSLYDPSTEGLDIELLEFLVRNSIRFLDDVQEISELPLKQVNYMCKGLRRLGLGVFGLADLLAELELAYDSKEAKDLANYLSWLINFFAWQESIDMAKEYGTFSLYEKDSVNLEPIIRVLNNSQYNPYTFDLTDLETYGVRNVSVTSIAPTGTIAILAGLNSGIEPYFALAYKRNITEGVGNIAKDYLVEVNPILFKKLKKYGMDDETISKVKDHIMHTGEISSFEGVPDKLVKVFKTASEINWKDHVDMQANWQNWISNAVSKTINLPNESTIDDIYNAYLYAWHEGVKGLTCYRDGSKMFQILVKAKK